MQVTYSHIKQVKRVAKSLKDTYPSLKLGQRQYKAAIQELGVRNYHEAIRLYEQWLMLHVHTSLDSDGVSKCSFCEFSFAADLKEDREAHRDVHERFHEASETLGYSPSHYAQRERMKRDGREQALSSENLDVRVEGLLLLLRGWFDRSLSKAIFGGYWRKHPSFELYVAMIQDTLSGSYGEVKAALKAKYGYRPGEIAVGDSNWYPKPR
ncbi:hypothetical protein IPC600_24465 [Pseudomonas aeruginosa]|jgi:hypothetical protein|uniref:hypothetical protein n=1 Tax=Pseudomonas aeruginosa TaxID=287 RepID=UPI0003E7700A|nr:hypothetical protein [Pseudomonas aeruginosa]AHH51006.1 hypothetical protein AI22_19330 [Pseudomonas aeruginosa YL84]EKB9382184.1 hypothetical protein [Pseudomonas aeruginosa]EKN7498938.1 hypothetical protein [Pseudomonas aeruginosa]EKQ6362268.1 hypothetical protein [Pseudomonas aeruginosa]EKV2960150.1 hypothetical protein [Pseudomonas aeruginosa]